MASTPQPSSYTYGGQAMKNTPSSHETSGTKEELYDREKQLAMQETRLREYQERVLRYEINIPFFYYFRLFFSFFFKNHL